MPRIAFDLDETLGVPIIDGGTMIGFQTRMGCSDLLERLAKQHTLVLWTVSTRRYAEKALGFGLMPFFSEVYTWDEVPTSWKDVRELEVDFLIDDSDHHVVQAKKHGIAAQYILVPAYGSPADAANPSLWTDLIEAKLAEHAGG